MQNEHIILTKTLNKYRVKKSAVQIYAAQLIHSLIFYFYASFTCVYEKQNVFVWERVPISI